MYVYPYSYSTEIHFHGYIFILTEIKNKSGVSALCLLLYEIKPNLILCTVAISCNFSPQIPEPDAAIQSISIDPMGTMMAAVNNKVSVLQ